MRGIHGSLCVVFGTSLDIWGWCRRRMNPGLFDSKTSSLSTVHKLFLLVPSCLHDTWPFLRPFSPFSPTTTYLLGAPILRNYQVFGLLNPVNLCRLRYKWVFPAWCCAFLVRWRFERPRLGMGYLESKAWIVTGRGTWAGEGSAPVFYAKGRQMWELQPLLWALEGRPLCLSGLCFPYKFHHLLEIFFPFHIGQQVTWIKVSHFIIFAETELPFPWSFVV